MTIQIFSSRFLFAVVGLGMLIIAGCDEINKMNDDVAKRPPAPALMPPDIETRTTGTPKAATPTPSADATNPAAPAADATANTVPPAAPDENLRKAEPGVGVQGQDYGGGALMAPITTPVREYFGMRDRVNFDMIKHDMDIFHAINNRWPKDDQEFKTAILEPGNRELPELRPGDSYVYDPKTGELLVKSVPRK